MTKKVFAAILFCMSITVLLTAQPSKDRWVDSVFQTMDMDEKIGQLMMVPVYKNTDPDYVDKIEDIIKSHHIGGIIFMQGGPVYTASTSNILQAESKTPLLMAVDAAWGLGKNLDSMMTFPAALSLGAIQNNGLIYDMGKELARQMKMLGLHINFAPTADLSMEFRDDTVKRSFGESRQNIAAKAVAYMQGMQDNGVLACAKHFPLKGITVLRMEKGLPVLSPYIDSLEIYPFKKLFDQGLTGVIPATSDFPLFYQKKKTLKKNDFSPSMLSSIFIGDWLKKQMNYNGLVFVNILSARDLAKKYRNGEAELFAFQAGSDVLLFPQSIGPAIRKIKRLIRKEEHYGLQLDTSVRKILEAKYNAGLSNLTPVSTDNLITRLNTPEAQVLKQKLFANAITVVRNEQEILPIKILDNKKIASISIGKETSNDFTHYLNKYAHVETFSIRTPKDTLGMKANLSSFNTIIVGLFSMASSWQKEILPLLRSLKEKHNVIICSFNSPYLISDFEDFPVVLEAYTDREIMPKLLAQVVFGALPANGKMPVSPSPSIREGDGSPIQAIDRLGYSFPEDAAMDSKTLDKIKGIAYEAIQAGATPGCHVLVVKDGKVVYEQSFGWHTYENKIPVSDESIYDLASVTKVSATLQTIMFMHDKGLLDINKKASVYLPELKNSNKKDITLKDILTHQAGLWPYLPFWLQTMKDTLYLTEFYNKTSTDQYPYVVAENLFGSVGIKDSLWNWIIKAKIREKAPRTPFDYRYSDMGFYILQHLAEKLLNQPMEDFLKQNLYDPLGAYTTGYLPLLHFPPEKIAPTENDKLFRKSLLIGMVHDQGAAMHGGIAGHAGLFSNANDLAKLAQMLLQEGHYGGIRYYKPETVRLFTQKQYNLSRRGLGWDKPTTSEWNGPTSMYASPKTFGHTGFTGTCIWVDPEFNLVYIFLSNRVHPDMNNSKLLNANIRSRIQDVIYESIFKYSQYGSGTCPEQTAVDLSAK